MDFAGFAVDWDHGNREKCQKHGLSIAEIEALFASDLMLFEDIGHSTRERRLAMLGPAVRYF
jgi:uncharacterized DUF497 family protein